MRRHEHNVRQEEVIEEHVSGRRIGPDDILVASAEMPRVQSRFQQMLQHLLRHAGHHRVPMERREDFLGKNHDNVKEKMRRSPYL